MSKGFKGKTCVYCGAPGSAETADHVFAREFFPVEDRAGLPKVPACRRCNADKAVLEHYLLTLLPFGGSHEGSAALLNTRVERRLARNAKLNRELSQGMNRAWVTDSHGTRLALTLPFDGAKLSALFTLITRGLTAYHWGAQIPQDYSVGAGLLTPYGESFLEPFLRGKARGHQDVTLGRGLAHYEGVQSLDDPYLSVWRYRLYGGVALGGDERAALQAPNCVWALSARSALPGLFSGN